MNKERFVPIADLASQNTSSHLVWKLPLPDYSGVGDFKVDTWTADQLAQIGALTRVTLVAGSFGGRSDRLGFSGVGSDGTANSNNLALPLPLGHKKEYSVTLLKPPRDPDLPFWREAVIGLDIDALAERLNRQKELSNPERWAMGVNHLAMRGLRSAAARNIATHDLQTEVACALGTVICPLASLSLPSETPAVLATICGGMSLAIISVLRIAAQAEKGARHVLPPDQIPYNAMPFGIDKLTWLSVASMRRRNLVRYSPS